MASSRTGSSLWIRAWLGAVARPAWRRAGAVWGALAVVCGVVMGPTALTPAALVAVIGQSVGATAAAGALWLLLLHPAARILLRSEAAAFLHTLPAPRGASVWPVAMLLAAHAPVVALLAAGAGARAAAVGAAALVAGSAALAQIGGAERERATPRWASAGVAVRSLLWARLARDEAVVRALGFTALAGAGAGLLLRNNGVAGEGSATLGLATLAIAGAPAHAAVLVPLAIVRRRLWPVCATSGVPFPTFWGAALLVHASAMAALAVVGGALAAAIGGLDLVDSARLLASALGLGAALGVTGGAVASWAATRAMVAERVVLGALGLGAGAAALMGLGAGAGLVAATAIAAAAALRVEEPVLC